MTEDNVNFDIGEICNYYGRLSVKRENGRCFWGIDDCSEMDYWEIPESLYLELLKHHKNPIQSAE